MLDGQFGSGYCRPPSGSDPPTWDINQETYREHYVREKIARGSTSKRLSPEYDRHFGSAAEHLRVTGFGFNTRRINALP